MHILKIIYTSNSLENILFRIPHIIKVISKVHTHLVHMWVLCNLGQMCKSEFSIDQNFHTFKRLCACASECARQFYFLSATLGINKSSLCKYSTSCHIGSGTNAVFCSLLIGALVLALITIATRVDLFRK